MRHSSRKFVNKCRKQRATSRANQRDAGIDAVRNETGFELTYSDQVTPWLRLQPDVQLVIDPNGDRARDDAWVAGLRIAITPWASET